MMRIEESWFRGAGGAELRYRVWRMIDEVRAVLVLVHGYGEHSGRYGNLVKPLVELGYGIYAYDHRGHGESPGDRGHIMSWGDYREDLQRFVSLVQEQEKDAPLFLYGHSMGGLIVLDYSIRHPEGLVGVIVSGPPIQPVGVAEPYQVFLAKLLSRIRPTYSMSLGFDAPALSRDEAVVKAYEEDPLVHCVASVRWGTESLEAIEWVKTHAEALSLPVLLVHGGADRVSSAKGSRWLFEQLAMEDKTLRVYPGVYHEPHNDLEPEHLVEDVSKWLARHLPERD